jgi:hypothetical protein
MFSRVPLPDIELPLAQAIRNLPLTVSTTIVGDAPLDKVPERLTPLIIIMFGSYFNSNWNDVIASPVISPTLIGETTFAPGAPLTFGNVNVI